MKLVLLIIVALGISGCSIGNTESDFLCRAQTGQPCATLSEIDGTASVLGGSIPENASDSQNKDLTQATLPVGKGGAEIAGVPAGGAPYQSIRYRIPEKTGRLWMPPYLDDSEILHEGTYVHFVVQDARWGAR